MALNSEQGKRSGVGNAIKRVSSILNDLVKFVSIQCGSEKCFVCGSGCFCFRVATTSCLLGYSHVVGLGEIIMYDESFWNERYSDSAYLYGTEPNSFLAQNANMLSSPVLSLSEGEGRNAVFLASRGLSVLGVDCSEVGLDKAKKLAKSRGVTIETEVADLTHFRPKENHYGSVISISAHLPSMIRNKLYPLIERSLKAGGVLLLEAYSENQLSKDTGGPKDIDMLMTVDKLNREFTNLNTVLLREIEREVSEGEGHTGIASVVQFIARKKA